MELQIFFAQSLRQSLDWGNFIKHTGEVIQTTNDTSGVGTTLNRHVMLYVTIVWSVDIYKKTAQQSSHDGVGDRVEANFQFPQSRKWEKGQPFLIRKRKEPEQELHSVPIRTRVTVVIEW